MIRRLVLLASSVAVLGIAVTACGDDVHRPKIKSFTANPAILPTLGGETTLTWDVKGADSLEIEPDIGVVTGSSLTISVTETTTFTLVAKGNSRFTRKRATVTLAAPGSVVGLVRSTPDRNRLPDIAVFCNGQATVTDENGMFHFEDVATPYDVSIFDPANAIAIIWQGLTRPDPILEIPGFGGVVGFTVGISGTATPASADVDTTTRVFAKNTFQALPGFDDADVTGLYDTNTSWTTFDDSPVSTAMIATRFVTNPVTGAITYTHFTRSDISVDPTQGPLTNVNIALAPVANAVATGDFLLDPQESLTFRVPSFILGTAATGAASDVGFRIPDAAFVLTTANAFTFASPDVSGMALVWQGYEEVAIDAYGYRAVRFAAGEQDVQVDFPQLPRLLTPIADGTISRETLFQMASLPESAKLWAFNTPNTSVLVITTKDRLSLPELPEAGIRFFDGDQIGWNLIEYSPLPSTDDLAGPDGLFGAAPELFGFSEYRTANLEAP